LRESRRLGDKIRTVNPQATGWQIPRWISEIMRCPPRPFATGEQPPEAPTRHFARWKHPILLWTFGQHQEKPIFQIEAGLSINVEFQHRPDSAQSTEFFTFHELGCRFHVDRRSTH
jgi:hypothetical protein